MQADLHIHIYLDGQCCPFSLFVNIAIFDVTCMAAGVGGELEQTMTSGSWFMLIFKLIVSVFLDGAVVVVVVVVVGFVVCFFVRWCFCCGCCCCGFCCFCVSLFVFCFLYFLCFSVCFLFSRKRPRRVPSKKASSLKTVIKDCHQTSPKVLLK